MSEVALDYLIPLLVLSAPAAGIYVLYRPLVQAHKRWQQGDVAGALAAYQRQLALVNRFPLLNHLRYFVLRRTERYSLREYLLYHMAQAHLSLGQHEMAVNVLWRCLKLNPHHEDALELLEFIRSTTGNRIIGW